MSSASAEVVWLRHLLEQLGFSQSHPTTRHVNNTSSIQIDANPIFHERTKHIEVDCHYIREALNNNIIFLSYISIDLQVVDIFTKVMTGQCHQFLVGNCCWLTYQHQFEGDVNVCL